MLAGYSQLLAPSLAVGFRGVCCVFSAAFCTKGYLALHPSREVGDASARAPTNWPAPLPLGIASGGDERVEGNPGAERQAKIRRVWTIVRMPSSSHVKVY